MPKQKTRSTKAPTKKQIALSGRQRQQKKRAYIGIAVLVGLIMVVVLVGIYDNLIARPSRPVAVVNNTTIRLDQYVARLRYERFTLDVLTQRIDAQLANMNTTDPSSNFMVQYFQQVRDQVVQQRAGLPTQVVDTMVEEQLARQKADEVGVTVSEDDVNEAIRARMAQEMGYVTQAQATSIASTAVIETATAELFTPTPLPTATPTLTVTVVVTETVPVTPTVEATPAPTPTSHIITDDEFSKEYAAYLKALNDQAGISEPQLREFVRNGLVVRALRTWFADQTPKEAEQVDVSHIQAATESQASVAMDRLNKGEDFALVASQVSSYTVTAAKGGELGWFMKGQLSTRYSPELEQAAFSLQPGTYSKPITSTVGWQIIKVNERAVRPLDANQLATSQAESYSNWLQTSKQGSGVQILWTPDMAPPDPGLQQSAPQ